MKKGNIILDGSKCTKLSKEPFEFSLIPKNSSETTYIYHINLYQTIDGTIFNLVTPIKKENNFRNANNWKYDEYRQFRKAYSGFLAANKLEKKYVDLELYNNLPYDDKINDFVKYDVEQAKTDEENKSKKS